MYPDLNAASRASVISNSPAAASALGSGRSDVTLVSPLLPEVGTYQAIAGNYIDRINEIVYERELAGTANTIVKDLSDGPVQIEWPLGNIKIDRDNQIRLRFTRDIDGFVHIYDEVFDRSEYPELFVLRDTRAEAFARLVDAQDSTGGVTVVR